MPGFLDFKAVVEQEKLRPLSLLCFVLKPKDSLTSETLEPTNALYIACEHPPYNDAQLYE